SIDIDVSDALESGALELLDGNPAVVEHAKARGAIARGVMQSGDRHEGAAALAHHDGLHGAQGRADDAGGSLVDALEGRSVAGVEQSGAARGRAAHEL